MNPVIQHWAPLQRSYFAINQRQLLIWNYGLRWATPKEKRWFFEGNRRIPGQLWLADRQALYKTVRQVKPQHVYEVGTWKGGGSTYFIAQALKDNNAGLLHTVEEDLTMHAQAVDLFNRFAPELQPHVSFLHGKSTMLFPPELSRDGANMVFLDGLGAQQTLDEFLMFEPYLKVGSILAAHDWNDEKTSLLRPYLDQCQDWQPLWIIGPPASVGMAVFQRVGSTNELPSAQLAHQVSPGRWQQAQAVEAAIWQKSEDHFVSLPSYKKNPLVRSIAIRVNLSHTPEDWNGWWQEHFDDYSFLPARLESMIEIGCGPYTNLRRILPGRQAGLVIASDPLIWRYATYRHAWLKNAINNGTVRPICNMAEHLPFPNDSCDCLALINVLDHVQNATQALDEAHRVLQSGGILVFGQDLTNAADMQIPENASDLAHPIRLEHALLDQLLLQRYEVLLYQRLPRQAGRSPRYHYGTYIFAGRKFSASD